MSERRYRKRFRHALRRRHRDILVITSCLAVALLGGLGLRQADRYSTIRILAAQDVADAPVAAIRFDGDGAASAPRATAAPATPSVPAAATSTPRPRSSPTPAAPKSKMLPFDFQVQQNGYYCGPAATRIAASVRKITITQDALARRLKTTVYGTNSAADVTRTLNSLIPSAPYRTTFINGKAATRTQVERMRRDVVNTVGRDFAMVTNIVGSAPDTNGVWHSYPGGHYVTVVGYRDDGRYVRIADPAYAGGHYWMTITSLANWAAQRGYSTV